MDSPRIYFAEVHTGGTSERTALGYIPENYDLFYNFMTTKLNHHADNGNTYRLHGGYLVMPTNAFILWQNNHGSNYTFEEFYNDMEILGYQLIHLPLVLSTSVKEMVKYVEENYIE